MDPLELVELANEALETFEEVSTSAGQKFASAGDVPTDGLAGGNTFTGGQAFKNLRSISHENREAWEALRKEPAIARLVLEDESGEQRVLYIARKSGMPLPSGKQLASYGSPLGRLAELPVGDARGVMLQGDQQTYSLIEKTSFAPRLADGIWDSIGNQYRHVDKGVFSIESLRALLQAQGVDVSDDLDRLLDQAAAANVISAGIRHQFRTAMALRDQPILDNFQGDIFRLPLDSQLIILGPPGTGKTTTLIKRLGQKLDVEYLEEHERRIADAAGAGAPHETNWMMFTPSELLKHYLKEAFNREQVPASEARIKTWVSYRNDVTRNTLGILRSPTGGRYTLKPDLDNLTQAVLVDPRAWFEAFSAFHDQRLRRQLEDGAAMAVESAPDAGRAVAESLQALSATLQGRSWMDVYRDLNARDAEVRRVLDDSKAVADQLLKNERNRLYNRDNKIFQRLAQFLAGLQQEDEPDEDDEFDEDETDATGSQAGGDIQNAVKAYLAALRSLSRSRYRKRSMPKGSRAVRVVEWLGNALPEQAVLVEIGQRISFQNGVRRFVNAFRRYVVDVPNSYRAFRTSNAEDARHYREASTNPLHLSPTELDAIVLLMLKNCRALLAQPFVARDLNTPRFESLNRLASLFRTQIMVDEATDFSALQLACMDNLTSLQSRSFFACGDFNQRITATGIRSLEQLTWAAPRIKPQKINLVYRQSRQLNAFAGDLLRLLDGDLSARGELPPESTHDGVRPVLLENASEEAAATWIADRIAEVERTVRLMPTIAVLVNHEAEVRPMAERLSACLEHVNLKAVPCEEGRALGEGTDVRVFDVKHIKGLEFEAVFFVGVDRLAEQKPDLFDRYLYVGATRAASYLGMVCHNMLPAKIEELRPSFNDKWHI